MKIFYIFICFFYSLASFSQSSKQLEEVVKNTNVAELTALSKQFKAESIERERRISEFLSKNREAKRVVYDGFSKKEIYDVINGEVWYYNTTNAGASKTIRTEKLYSGGGLGLNVQGQGMKAFVWDGGGARSTHEEFPGNKVTIIDGAELDDHATHVTGTIVAQGINPLLRGIAFNASVDSYDWNSDYSEMTTEASLGMLVSNHSYWIGNNAVWNLGSYDTRARQFDQIAFNAPYYLAVTAAGNDRNDTTDPVVGPYLQNKFGYNLVRGMQNGKNYLTVGAVSQVSNYTSPTSVVMSGFSSWGPTDDGRIKPEVVAKGVGVRSTTSGTDTANASLQGTSMASPAVAGSALLLQQHYHNVFGSYMRAASLKGLLMHTADESGFYPGPDYEFGWGLVNAEKAANLITNKNTNTAVIEELILNTGNSYTKSITTNGSTPLMVSISWTERPGTANSGTVDPTNLNIVNDLDVRVVKADNTIYFPWTLDPALPYSGATNTVDNFRDNFEKVEVENPSGTYNIIVTHKGTLAGNSQNFSLIVSGPQMTLSSKEFTIDPNAISIYPNPANNILNFNVSENVTISYISIVDITGKLINSSFNLNQKTIDVSDIQSGVYFVRFTSEDKTVTKKFIKN